MDKQSIIAFVLIGLILSVWLYLNQPAPVETPAQLPDSTAVESQIDTEKTSTPEIKETEIPEPEEILIPEKNVPEKIINVETDLFRAEFTNKGGRLKKLFLKNFKTWYYKKYKDGPYYKKEVQLINQQEGGEISSVFVTKDGKLLNTANLNFTSDAQDYYYRLKDSDSLTLSYEYKVAENKVIRRSFKLYGNNYRSKVEMELINLGKDLSGSDYDFMWKNGVNFVEKNSVDEANYSNVVIYSGYEHLMIDASSTDEVEKKDLNGQVDWIGLKVKYFGVIISPEEKLSEGGAFVEGTRTEDKDLGPREYYTTGYRVPLNHSDYQKNVFDLYIGPLNYDILKSYDKNYQELYDFGSFMGMSFLIRPISEFILLPVFQFLHNFIPNYGFVIIVFSLLIKIVLYPLTSKSFKSMKRMQMLQPKIAELKEKYKDDQQKVSQETMKLYSTYGINPAGGCLPMLLQMPILVALWSLFNVAIELRNQPFILWIQNLSAPDVIMHLPDGFPLISHLSGLAILMGISMFLQQKMTMKDPSQKAMVYMMPVMMTIMFMNLPSGVNLYYLMFNLISILQQYIINKSKSDVELVPVNKPKKAGFMQRMMEAAEQQQKNQQQTRKKR